MWHPTRDQVDAANVTRLLSRHGLAGYRELLDRANADPAWYWQAVIDDLGIRFDPKFERVFDLDRGIEWPRWFDGGGINIAMHCVERWAVERPSALAMIAEREDGKVAYATYRELQEALRGVAQLLVGHGVREGDRVAILMPLGRQSAATLYAVARIGAIAVPMFTGFSAVAVAQRMRACEATVIVTVDSSRRHGRALGLATTAREVLRELGSGTMITLASVDEARPLSWSALVELGNADRSDPTPTTAETPVMINYTSGTTGSPKGAVHVHGGLLVKVASEAAYLTDLKCDDRALWITDLGWLMGPWLLIGAHAAGATVVTYEGAIDHPDGARLWRLCDAHQVTMLGVSPTLMRILAGALEHPAKDHDLTALRILGSTGEPWDTVSYQWALEAVGMRRCPIVNMSGGTEVGACFLGQPPVLPAKACSVGVPLPGMAVDVVDDTGSPLRRAIGELVCRAPWPSQTRGFWSGNERYLETYWSRFDQVWVHGDWASIDDDGYWFIHGRSDDTLNVAGKRIGPAEIEGALLALPEIAECAAVGAPDPLKGTAIWCFCVPATTTHVERGALTVAAYEAVAANVGRAFADVHVVICNALPKTRSGKIVRRAIRACLLDTDPGDLSSLESPDAVAGIVEAIRART